MSTGISISSINRIKELAEEKKFKEALEILDTQDLDKSINPQFLRISGEIFRENKRYYDSRKFLLKAHQMSPQGNRIIRELIELYLELGYFSKAQKYYEQYMFYTTPEDTQKEFVEYIMKKATGADVKELAAILIPILERMPGEQWNFEAVLLYHKMDRKDMALEESRYILENFKESVYVQPVIDYIDEQLDVDQWFYVYPKEEVPEDMELYGDLIALEEKILEADYRLMYPPEARIMVEADDNDAEDVKPAKSKKEKKAKKRVGKNSKKKEKSSEENEQQSQDDISEDNSILTTTVRKSDEKKPNNVDLDTEAVSQIDEQEMSDLVNETSEAVGEEKDNAIAEEKRIQKEREAALEKLLSRKIDKDRLKESAQQAAQVVRDIDVSNAKQQMKNVVDSVKDNVKKASDVLGEAVGAKQTEDKIQEIAKDSSASGGEEILDGIIESVLEPPKKMVGEIVMNEELDALIPDSLEAMSEQETADIEARKVEMERLELEALEAALKLEEEKKAKKNAKSKHKDASDIVDTEQNSGEESTESKDSENIEDESLVKDSEQKAADASDEVSIPEEKLVQSDGVLYEELKSRFMEGEDIQPLDSLGFITVVHSDVDEVLEEEMPDAAGMLRQMIGNKEFYSGENSLGFESKASYENHGFEIEDYDFDVFRMQQEDSGDQENNIDSPSSFSLAEEIASVEEIYTKESVVAFEDVVFDEVIKEESIFREEDALNDTVEEAAEETVLDDTVEEAAEETVLSDTVEEAAEETVLSDTVEEAAEETVLSDTVEEATEETVLDDMVEEAAEETVLDDTVKEDTEEVVLDNTVEDTAEEAVLSDTVEDTELSEDVYMNYLVEETIEQKRKRLKVEIVLSSQMVNILLELKESR